MKVLLNSFHLTPGHALGFQIKVTKNTFSIIQPFKFCSTAFYQ